MRRVPSGADNASGGEYIASECIQVPEQQEEPGVPETLPAGHRRYPEKLRLHPERDHCQQFERRSPEEVLDGPVPQHGADILPRGESLRRLARLARTEPAQPDLF